MGNIRLRCIDFLKGLAMIAVICAHTSFWINDPNQMWAHGIAWMIFQFCGPAGFSIMTSVSVTIATRSKQNKGINNKKILKGILNKFIIFYAIGILFVADFSGGISEFFNPMYLTRMHIFQLIAISQLLTFFALKLKPRYRIFIAVLIILLDTFGYPYIVQQMELNTSISPELFEGPFGYMALESVYGWIYMIFFRMSLHMGVMPWILIPFIASIGGDLVYKHVISKFEQSRNNSKNLSENARETQEYLSHNLKPLYLYSLLLYVVGILFGLQLLTYFRGVEDLQWLNSGGGFYIDAYPTFLFNGSWQSLFYCTGIVLGFLGIGIFTNDLQRNDLFKVFKTPDIKQTTLFYRFWLKIQKKLIKFIDALEIFGKYSMTAFCLHFVLRIWQNFVQFPPLISTPIMFAYAFLNILIINIWENKLKGKYTLEYFINPKSS